MDGRGPLTEDAAFKALGAHYDSAGKSIDIASQFASDKGRFDKLR